MRIILFCGKVIFGFIALTIICAASAYAVEQSAVFFVKEFLH